MPQEAVWGRPTPTRGHVEVEKIRNKYKYLGKLPAIKSSRSESRNAIETDAASHQASLEVIQPGQRSQVASKRGSVHTQIPMPESILPGRRLCLLRRNACEALRLLILGTVGNEEAPDEKTRLAILLEGLGRRADVVKVFNELWRKLTPNDPMGLVTIDDLQRYLLDRFHAKVQRQQVERVIACILDKHKDGFMGFIGLAHIVRLVWPGSSNEQLQRMLRFVDEFQEDERCHVPEPPALPNEDYKALWTTFHHLYKQSVGKGITFDILVRERYCDADQANRYRSDFGLHRDDEINLQVFLMMMCPVGFRAFKSAVVGTSEKDEWLTLCSDGRWQRAGPPKSIPGLQDIQPDLPSNAELDLADLDVELLS